MSVDIFYSLKPKRILDHKNNVLVKSFLQEHKIKITDHRKVDGGGLEPFVVEF